MHYGICCDMLGEIGSHLCSNSKGETCIQLVGEATASCSEVGLVAALLAHPPGFIPPLCDVRLKNEGSSDLDSGPANRARWQISVHNLNFKGKKMNAPISMKE